MTNDQREIHRKKRVLEDASLRALYTEGLRGIDVVAKNHAGARFTGITPSQQDAVLRDLENGKAAAWPAGDTTAQDFFAQIWIHTLWGFLSDPKYGGNQAYVGWRVLGYPGGRHRLGGYSPEKMAGAAQVESVWGEKLPRRPPS